MQNYFHVKINFMKIKILELGNRIGKSAIYIIHIFRIFSNDFEFAINENFLFLF
jgi:hypothetical protein